MIKPQFRQIDNALKTVIGTICFNANLQNVIFVGSFADFCNYDRFIVKPKDLDIICTSMSDLGSLKGLVTLEGPFEEPVYQKLFSHKQYFFNLFGIRTDIFVAKNLEDYQQIDTRQVDYYGHKIRINSEDESMKMHLKCMELFREPKDSVELYRLRKHSKRYSFYNMIKENVL